MSSAAELHKQSASQGVFNYVDQTTPSSLYRNGKVLIQRDPDGNDGAMQGVTLAPHEMRVHNGRAANGEAKYTLASSGFELLSESLANPNLDFLDQQQVLKNYYPECAAIVAKATGAKAFAFDHNVRSARGKENQARIAGGQQVQEPLHMVHGDYTLTSAPQRLRDLAKPPSGNDTLRNILGADESLVSEEIVEQALSSRGRFAIINVWRNIAPEPVAMHPLALCDGQSVNPDDLVVFEIHYQNRIGENYFAKHADRHRWVYFPAMTRDEPLLIKQWDSAGTLAHSKGERGDASDPQAPCTFSFHTAFDDANGPANAPDRQSIEVRCLVIYDPVQSPD